ncbi:MAG: hypothetical protein JWM96_748, partial [Alphaproteobacteria bacterium]|nr:hypothetical protein [Alphaproteobacteria bacterium]
MTQSARPATAGNITCHDFFGDPHGDLAALAKLQLLMDYTLDDGVLMPPAETAAN